MSETEWLVRISHPFRINSEPVGRFTVWLLAATVLASRAPVDGAREVAAPFAQGQLRRTSGLSMALSRACAAYQRHAIPVGWGEQRSVPVSSLSPRGRVRGPFWIDPEVARRIRFVVGDQPVDAQALQRFVGAESPAERLDESRSLPAREPMDVIDLRSLHRLVDARQRAEESLYAALTERPLVGGTSEDALSLMLDVGVGARSAAARRWGLFHAAQQARKHGQLSRARELLHAASGIHTAADDLRGKAFVALCDIGRIWCDYQERRLDTVRQDLVKLETRMRREGIPLDAHPRLSAEFHNLRALWQRATMDELPRAKRRHAARQVIIDLQSALLAALEMDSLGLMESIASNLGYSIWLLDADLPDDCHPGDARLEAVRWILLSDWLCHRHGFSGASAWNLIAVCRVVRGAGHEHPGELRGLKEDIPHLSLAQVRAAAGHTAASLGSPQTTKRWIDVTTTLVASATSVSARLPPLQRAAAMLEHLWQVSRERPHEVSEWTTRIKALMHELVPKDRAFFRRELRAIARTAPPTPPVGRRSRPQTA